MYVGDWTVADHPEFANAAFADHPEFANAAFADHPELVNDAFTDRSEFANVSRLQSSRTFADRSELTLHSQLCVHGYHIYSDIWEAAVGEELLCECEPKNTKDSYA